MPSIDKIYHDLKTYCMLDNGKISTFKASLKNIEKKFPGYLNKISKNFKTFQNKSIMEFFFCYEHNIHDYPLCPVCKKEMKIFSGYKNMGYGPFCSKQCSKSPEGKKITLERLHANCLEKYGVIHYTKLESVKEKCKQTCLEKYGVDSPFKSDKTKEKGKQTCLKKYGVEYASQSKVFRKKVKQTCLKKYGVDCTLKSKEINQKARQTCLEKYGKEWYTQTEQYKTNLKKTCLEKYGVEHFLCLPQIQQKARQTCLEKYGKEWYTQTEQYKEDVKNTLFKKYGKFYTNPGQVPEIKEKVKQTCLEKYGVINIFQVVYDCPEFKKFKIEKFNTNIFDRNKIIEKMKINVEKTFYKKYGVRNIFLLQEFQNKAQETKRINCTFNSSKIEEAIYEYLCNKYEKINIYRQYKEDRYPWRCDFYIKTLDIFIEIQGSWTHGKHPYNDEIDKDRYNILYYKSLNSEYYKSALFTWTVSDIKKRNTAKQNNLNYFEYFGNNLNDFKEEFTQYLNENFK